MMFTDEIVLSNDVPLHWVQIASSQTSKSEEPASSQEQSHSRNRGAHAQGSFVAAHSLGRSKPTVAPQAASPSPTCEWKVPPPRICRDSQVPMGGQFTTYHHWSPTGADHTTRPLCGDHHSHRSLCQDAASGTTYLDMVTTSMSLVGLGATPRVINHPMPTLRRLEDLESD